MRSFLLFLVALLPAMIAKSLPDNSMIDDTWDTPASMADPEHDSTVPKIGISDSMRPSDPSDAQNQIANTADANTGFTPENSGDGLLDPNLLLADSSAQAGTIQGQQQCTSNDPTTVNKRASSEGSSDACAKPNPILKGPYGEEKQCHRSTKTVCCMKAQIAPSGEFWIGNSCYPFKELNLPLFCVSPFFWWCCTQVIGLWPIENSWKCFNNKIAILMKC